MKIAWLVIGTNHYLDLALECFESIRANYSGNQEQEFILFTNRSNECTLDWVKTVAIPHEPFPLVTLNRYKYFSSNRSLLKKYDYIYYVDADMQFVSVGDEILGKRVVTLHPAFVHEPSSKCTFDRNPKCLAYVPNSYHGPYYQNCFQGGESRDFLRMCRRLSRRIRVDLFNKVMPLWHDESHMNCYMIKNSPTRVLHPGYAYPDWWKGFNFQRRIINVKKDADSLRFG